MKYIFFVLFLSTSLNTVAQSKRQMEVIKSSVDKIEEKVISWRRDIHAHPELGNREIRTSALIADHLRSLGIEVQSGVAKTGVVGILKGSQSWPVIGLRADMDALPVTERTNVPFASKVTTTYDGRETGVMHACGHDSHVAVLMGVAEILAGMKQLLKGTVKFIFQPAEEGAPKGEEGGAELMVKEGVLDNPKVDVIFGIHSNAQLEVGKISYRPESFFAGVNDFKITIKGKSSHGAEPWASVDPVLVSAQVIYALQTIVSRNVNLTQNPAVITVGSIHGGNRSNIIPEQVEMLGTIRALSVEDEKLMVRRVRQVAEQTAKAGGAIAEVEIPYSIRYPVGYNDPVLTQSILPTLERSAGKDNVLLIPAETGSEDFAFFQEKIPGFYFYFGGLPKGQDPKSSASHHTPDFYLDESGFKTAVIALANLVVDFGNLKGGKINGR